MTIRERITSIQNKLAAGDVSPDEASKMMNIIAALYGNINDEIRACDLAYAKILLNFLDTETKANRAKIKAECSKEFENKCVARNIKTLADEILRSLRYFLKTKEQEYRAGRYQ